MAAELTGKIINGWVIGKLIDNGKSALVLHAIKDGNKAAIKIFDRELVETFGKDVQLERIDREKQLIGKHHDNLIKIIDGGYCPKTDFCYVVMEYLPGDTLSKVLKSIPVENIADIISQLASAAKFLDDLELAHRDIKPDNIRLLNDKGLYKAVLLDLGVIRPTSVSKITDGEGYKSFIGTLQYSSPEFLLREEQDTPDGWRAVTFYQLGAVLHDLIMRTELFHDQLNPFAKLVNAVQHKTPNIHNNNVDAKLVILARNCLIKNPVSRLKSVSYDDFSINDASAVDIESLKKDMINKIAANKVTIQSSSIKYEESKKHIQFKLQTSADDILKIIKGICSKNRSIFPPMENQIDFTIDNTIKILLTFMPSITHSLYGYLYIAIEVTLEDVTESVYSIDISSILSSEVMNCADFNNTNNINIYNGVYDIKQIESLITAVFFKLYAYAQEFSIANNKSAEIIEPVMGYCCTDILLHV